MVESTQIKVKLDLEFYSEEKEETLELSLEGGFALTGKGFRFQPDEVSMDPIDIKFDDFTVFATQKGQLIYTQCLIKDKKFQQCMLELGLTEEEFDVVSSQESSDLTITILVKDPGQIKNISDHFNSNQQFKEVEKSSEDAVVQIDAIPGAGGWITADTPLDQIEDFEIPKHIQIIDNIETDKSKYEDP